MGFLRFCAILLVSAISAASAQAVERLALIIGNGAYTSSAMPALQNPTNDAALMAATLEKAGFNVELVMNADLRTMKRAVSAFASNLSAVEGETLAFFYYSGHGFQANNLNYLAPLGADLRDEVDAEFEAMSVDWVLAKLEAAHGGANVIVLDACRNTALSRGTGEGLALMARTPLGSFISYATAPGSTAADGVGLNSPYTSAIAREVLRPGLSIEAAFKNVRRQVVEATGGQQVPWDYSSLTGDVMLVATDAKAASAPQVAEPAEALVELQFWNDAKDQGTVNAIQSYLDRYPDGAFAPLARDRLTTLGGGTDPAALQAIYARLTARGLIVETPTKPHEFYANARLHEIQGDYVRARQDYLKFFAFDLDKVDPHYRFQTFLRVQEGRTGARRIYNGLTRGLSDPAAEYAALLLLDRDQKIGGLQTFIASHPEFAPAWLALAQEYAPAVLGRPSIADKTEEERLLKRFIALTEEGHFLRYFYDQQVAAQQLTEARERLAALSVIAPDAKTDPVRFGAMWTNQGWQVHIYIADDPTEIFVEHDGRPERSTGFIAGGVHPQTGKPLPHPVFAVPGDSGPLDVRVSYLDTRGTRHGPFQVRFDPALALVRDLKEKVVRFPGNWISFRDWEGQRRVYYANLAAYRCAIETLMFGVGRDVPDQEIKLAECNVKDPHTMRGAAPFIVVPRGTAFVTVEVSFRDGSRSDVVKFPAP